MEIKNKNFVKKKIKSLTRHNGGGIIVSYDYSTLEIRIFSAISCDPTLRDVLLSGADLHCNTARNIFPELKDMSDKEIKEHHSGLRSKAKSTMFGLLYGKSAYNFSKEWGCTVEEAQETIDKMMGAYPGIKTYVEYQHKFAREHGYIVDVFGCTRPLPDAMLPDTKSNRKLLNHAMNASQNSGIQSSASRMAWIAGTHIAEEMLMHDLQSVMIGGVHDSTYLDIYPGELIPVFKICQFHAGTVPNVIYDWMNGNKMFIDFGLGQSWGREMDIKSFEEKDGKFILNIKGGNCNWDYLKRELDEAYDYKILEMKEGDPIPPEEREELPIEVPTQLISLKLEFEDPCPNMEFKSKYFVGNGFYGKREE